MDFCVFDITGGMLVGSLQWVGNAPAPTTTIRADAWSLLQRRVGLICYLSCPDVGKVAKIVDHFCCCTPCGGEINGSGD